MDSKKKKLLEESYERIMNVGLCIVPYEDLSDIVAPNAMAYGTTIDEQILSFTDLDELFKSQYEQMSNMEPALDRKRICTRISNDGNNAFIVEEATLTLSSPEAVNTFFARISCVMEYMDSKWKLTHWHGSTPVDTENDHWHMEEWKREKEKLQQLVDQQTADLQQKNRELEIEAAIERVRAVAMGMTKQDDMLDVCHVISDQLQQFGVEHIRNVQTVIINEEKGTYHNYLYFTAYKKETVEITEYHKNPVVLEMAKRMLESADGFFTGNLAGKEFEEFRAWRKQENQFPDPLLDETDSTDYHFYSIGPGGLGLTLYQPLNEESLDIFKRFHNVFSLAYRRFRDIEQAEAQAREAQIELALERVRARTMAMQHSDELKETSELLFQQIQGLGIHPWSCGFSLWYDDDSYFIGYNPGPDGKIGPPLKIPLTEDLFFTTIREAKRRGEEFLVFESEGESLAETYRYMDTLPVVGEVMRGIVQSGFELPTYQVTHCGFFPQGHLMFITLEPHPEAWDIFKRFTRVFEQTYTRFLDLQKAEKQTREAEIELALERVRARTMAMQHSDELAEASAVLDAQVRALGIKTWGCAFNIYGEHDSTEWFSSESGILQAYKVPRENVFLRYYDAGQRGESLYIEEFAGEECIAHYDYLCTLPVVGDALKKVKESGDSFPARQIDHVAYFKYGYLLFITLEPEPEAHDIFIRFAKVFEQTYTRFLDLQKAEAQAREARIEAALEKVRSRTMGMQSSEELPEVANLLFLEVQALGIPAWSCGYCILLENGKSSTCIMSSEGTLQRPFHLPFTEEDSFLEWYRFVQSNETFFTQELGGKAIESHYNFMKTLPQLKPILEDLAEAGLSLPTYQINHLSKFTHGFLLFITYEKVPDSHDIFKRFTNVFDQTYTRFLDLKKAEAQAKEATKQASLDRVRGEIASMRSAQDLEIITPLVWRELTTLGVPFFRCGVFIIDEATEQAHVYLSTPSGQAVAALQLKFDSTPLVEQTVQHWKQGKVYREEWNRQQFQEWTQSIMEQHLIESAEQYQAGQEAPEKLALQFVPFTQGMLYIGSSSALSEDEIEIGQALANAFGVAYARYEDFQKLEAAKAEIEAALENLKKTQNQLIQAEKMASLGQLTAGIAHEIKNPLNFVNNFSELSTELVEELKEELEKNSDRIEKEDADSILAILSDLEQNTMKINEHGKRADGIVKSMLQHSRGSSGERQSIDINAMLDESLNLAYHGMRARDASFNTAIEKKFDANLAMVECVPQNISRVFLNIITNSFNATHEKQQNNKNFSPRLTAETINIDGKVEIRIHDNGSGIPEDIRERIFQPFFTTKPTGQGTGLGLSISYDIVVQEHNGEIRMDSKEGEFTEFVVTLPR